MKRRVVAAAGLVVGLAVLATASPAFAHVTVSGQDATQGGYATLTFKVPTESDTASTTKLTVTFPAEAPIASVAVQPKTGWTVTTTQQTLQKPLTDDDGNQVSKVVGSVTWTASPDAAIKPGEFDTFNISAGPLPKVSSLAFAATQTYSDGSVVNWNQVAAPGSSEPDHPKPTLTLAAADAGTSAASSSASSSSAGTSSSDTTALVLSILALVLAAGALGIGVVSRARSTQPTQQAEQG